MKLEAVEDRKKLNKKIFVAVENFERTIREMAETMQLWKQQLGIIENILDDMKRKL